MHASHTFTFFSKHRHSGIRFARGPSLSGKEIHPKLLQESAIRRTIYRPHKQTVGSHCNRRTIVMYLTFVGASMASSGHDVKIIDLAIFSRNHPTYLAEAACKSPGVPVTFRSNVRWVRAAKAIDSYGSRRIYFAPIGGGGQVAYEADLVQVQVDPSRHSPTTKKLLQHVLLSTKREKLWNDSVQTLYAIANCRRIANPFPQTRLRKEVDGLPLDKNYIRSYAIVHEYEARAV